MGIKNKTCKKLNSEKGVTGVDIVVSITMIVLAVSVIMAIYTNINITSKKITRTAGATRMATNMIEYIDALYYEEFLDILAEYEAGAGGYYSSTQYVEANINNEVGNGKYIFNPLYYGTKMVLNTTIPTGYGVILNVSNVYGEDGTRFDLIRKVEIIVEFKVGNKLENVKFQTLKKREKLAMMANDPIIKDDNFANPPNDFDSIEFIEVKKDGNNYKKVNPEDGIVYTYNDNSFIPKLIIPKKIGDVDVFNGDNVKDVYKDYVYAWIPAHNMKIEDDGSMTIIYGYRNTDNHAIKTEVLEDTADSTKTFSIYTVDVYNTIPYGIHENANKESGLWVKKDDLALNDYFSRFLSKASYTVFN